MISHIKEFLRLETSGSILLLIAAVLALVLKNSPVESLYDSLLSTIFTIQIGAAGISKPLLLWINDGLMAIFFFLIGLELKREIVDGELSEPKKVILPMVGALGGMLVPALIYVFINWGNSVSLNGWAIPAATDIAFALGVLAVLGKSVPTALKIFLLTLAIVDDLGAILIIAFFYSGDLSIIAASVAAFVILLLFTLNRRGVESISSYILLGVILWIAVLKSGVHATLAGVILAFFIPYKNKEGESPVKKLEHDLHPVVAYVILPIFAFANSGVSLAGVTLSSFAEPVTLGILLGLFLGKQIGVFGFAWVAIKLGLGKLQVGLNLTHIYGVSLLAGIGFTMSLFIGSLAFEHGGQDYSTSVRMGIISGSLLSALFGYLVLRTQFKKSDKE
jgi:NhaA family Na+:H+ antiporter